MPQMTRDKRKTSKAGHGRSARFGRGRQDSRGPIEEHDLPDLQKARRLWTQMRFDDAIELFERTVRHHPRNILALTDTSRALGNQFELTRAEDLLDRLVGLAPDRGDIQFLAGQSYRMMHRPDKAIQCLSQAIHTPAVSADACLELALILERRNELDEAITTIDRGLQQSPDYPEAILIKARLLGRAGAYGEAEDMLRTLVEHQGKVHPMTRANAWAVLAIHQDSQGDYDRAFATMLESKRILRAPAEQLFTQHERIKPLLPELISALSSSDIKRWRDQASGFEHHDVALLTGAPRSGTTLLEKVLDAHQGIVSSDEREAFARHSFMGMLGRYDGGHAPRKISPQFMHDIPPQRLLAERRRYLRYMEAALGEPIGGRVHLDKNPSIMTLTPAMLRLFPECKLLIALRDPRDVVISCFMQFLPLNPVTAEYLSLEQTARRYCFEMDVWLKLRELLPSQWMEVRYEDVVADLPQQARRAIEFLGMEWSDEVLDYRSHLSRRDTNSPTFADVAKPVYSSSIGRWRNYEKHFEPVLETLEPFVRTFGYA